MMMKLTLCTILLLVLQASSFPLDDFDKRQAECNDEDIDCPKYASYGGCNPSIDWYEYMEMSCKRTCNLCGQERCKDKYSNCPSLAENGYCSPRSMFYETMKTSCKLSCKFCKGSTVTTQAPPVKTQAPPVKTQAPPVVTQAPTGKTSGQAVLIKGTAGPCLQAHNQYRAQHSAPALTMDSELTSSSEKFAQLLANTNGFYHSDGNYGENLYQFSASFSQDDPVQLCQMAVKAWYDEINLYNFNNPGYSSGTGHFTQVVWKASTKLGMGVAKITQNGYSSYYAVARYTPPGNYRGQFRENVLPKN